MDKPDLSCKFPRERERLLRMKKKEQAIRIHGDFNKPQTVLDMLKIDLAHQKQLVKILETITLPSTANIGHDGAEAVWLIAQHAAYNLSLMKEVLKLMQTAMKNNPKNGYHRGLPYLIDRINIMEGQPQLYGTQFWASPDGTPIPYPIKNFKEVEARRKKFGLRSFRDYKKDIIEASELTKRPIYHILY